MVRAAYSLMLLLPTIALSPLNSANAEEASSLSVEHRHLSADVLQLLKNRCGKCHGPAEPEAGLMLMTLAGVAHGSDEGPVVSPGDLDNSPIWQRVVAGEMPPEDPLSDDQRHLLQKWIEAQAPGLELGRGDHWAFRKLKVTDPPAAEESQSPAPIDIYVQAKLSELGITPSPQANRTTLIRRVSFDLTGLPPSPEEIATYLADHADGAYQRMVERYLASPHYGEHWGNHWLDTAGYADSNGYFNADTDRPLAYRYRDYVIRARNADKPFDQFIHEQLAGDELAELAGYQPDGEVTAQIVELFEATHYLRNAQDGTDSSDGNPDEVKNDKYKALEGTLQIIGSSLLGLKLQCARCHQHKFEPIQHNEYYQLQAILYPALNIDNWIKPKDRIVFATQPEQLARWEANIAKLDAKATTAKQEYEDWLQQNKEQGIVAFADQFDDPQNSLEVLWSNTPPDSDTPLGNPSVALDAVTAPAANNTNGHLQILESGQSGDRALSTRQSFDWTPNQADDWIQVSFDLVSDKIDNNPPSARIAYFISLVGFHNDENRGGNILIDGNPAGGAAVHLRYPGAADTSAGTVGSQKYQPGRSFGIRVTNSGEKGYHLEHIVDGVVEGESINLQATDLPDGGFGFEYCCGRSFIIDNVRVETNDPSIDSATREKINAALTAQREQHDTTIKAIDAQRTEHPGKIAWVSETSPDAPQVYRLERGEYNAPQEQVHPAALAVLSEESNPAQFATTNSQLTKTSGSRLAFAHWLTSPDSKAAALLARVTVNRIWQHHFGTGITPTSDNLGYSGATPTHPDLLDWLAQQFIRDGWSMKSLHRHILNSATYRQSSATYLQAQQLDPNNTLLWRYPLRRLAAESIRDAMLAASGELDQRMGGPYIPTSRRSTSEVIVDENTNGAHRRSVYLQHRRTQIESVLKTFDAPSIVFNCSRRDSTTVPLQSLALLNSDFVRRRAHALATRIRREVGTDTHARIDHAFLLVLGRTPTDGETLESNTFLAAQPAAYPDRDDAEQQSWVDFCQMLMASNAFLYLE